MKNIINYDANITNSEAVLNNAMAMAEKMLFNHYLEDLKNSKVIPFDIEKSIDIKSNTRFFKISKIVLSDKEKLTEQLTTISNTIHSIGGSMAVIIQSDGEKVDYYLGSIGKDFKDIYDRNASFNAFSNALSGNLVGSQTEEMGAEEMVDIIDDIFDNENENASYETTKCLCSISGIPFFRDTNRQELLSFSQGLEHMMDALEGKEYTIVSIFDPISNKGISNIKKGYEMIYNQLYPFLKTEISISEQSSNSLSETQSNTISDSIAKGIAISQSRNETTGTSQSVSAGVHGGIIVPVMVGASLSVTGGKNQSSGTSEGSTDSSTTSKGTSISKGLTNTLTTGTGMTKQISAENRLIKTLLNKIDMQIERLELCESYGGFDCATYVIADTRSNVLSAAGNFNAIIRGESETAQSSYINTWSEKPAFDEISKHLKNFYHPMFDFSKDNINVYPSLLMTAKEMSLLMGMPQRSVNGISVIESASFGRNIESTENGVNIGKLYHMGKCYETSIDLDVESLCSHTFITGSTGSGKSNAVYKILSELSQKKVTFLVIEPAKGEYKHVFGNRKDINVFGTNPKKTQVLRINPFKFPKDIHVLEHIDRLIEIFNVCWPMYAAMPAVLKDAVERSYICAGWDLETSENSYSPPLYPSFSDVLSELYAVINESDFSAELKSNYTGALMTRVKSLTNGINGQIFVSDEISDNTLFDQNTIVDLSRVASIETKAMIMGMLLMKLQEYRMSVGGMNRKLRHVTVLEEAHNLLKRTSTEQSSESSNLLGKSVEMLSQSIAEMRTYGEGFIIADQSPNMLDMSVIRNTNTKIILRLPDMSDRELCGRAANLNEEQIIELAKLPTGVGAIYQNNWIEPVLCKVEKFHSESEEYIFNGTSKPKKDTNLKPSIVRSLLSECAGEKVEYSIDDFLKRVAESSLSAKAKVAVIKALKNEHKQIENVSVAISALFDTESILKAAFHSKDIAQWNKTMLDSIDLGQVSETYRLLVLQCFLSRKARESEEFRDMYSKWSKHMRNEVK